METQWKEKKVLITGATSGLGLALALELAERGARIAVVARNEEGLQALRRRIDVIGIRADVSKKEDIHAIAAEAIARLGGIDLLVNNASYLGATPLRLLLDTDCEDFEKVLQTNLLGPFRLTKAILPTMLLQKSGLVLNISSDAGVSAYPTWGAYGVSKAAISHLSEIWNEELSAEGVRFLALDPGDMNTPMHEAAVPGADPSTLLDPREAAIRILRKII